MAKYQKYAEYKDSGEDWLGEIPVNWDLKKHKYIAIFSKGKNPDLLVDQYSSGLYPYLSMDSLRGKSESKYAEYKKGLVLVKDNQPLIIWDGSNSGEFVLGKKGILSSTMASASLVYEIDNKFYWYTCICIEPEMRKHATGMGIPHVNGDELRSISLPLPNLNEQEKIANFLDHETAKIDTLIAKQEKLIELLKEKRQAVISHAVTKGLNPNVPMKDSGVEWLGEVPEHWNMAPVRRYLVEHRQGYYTTESYVDEGLKLLRITDLRDLGEINISNCPMVNESDTTHLFKLQKGDVVFARTGGAGSFGVITEDYENLIYASYLIRFRFMNKIFEPDYLRFLFQSDSFQLSVKQNIHGGVNQNIHAEDIKNTVICAPSLSEQKEIIEYLENQCLLFENLIYKASYSVKLMQERRTALISAAVTGKIDVRNWQAPTLAEADTELSA